MSRAESIHNVLSTSCSDNVDDQYVTAAAPTSMAPSSHETSLYVTASEAQITAAIETSKNQGWSELAKVGTSQGSPTAVDALVWEELKKKNPELFRDDVKVKLGRVIAEGGQAQICEAEVDIHDDVLSRRYRYVAKVFKMDGFSLADFQRQWPLAKTRTPPWNDGPLFGKKDLYHCTSIDYGLFLEDGRFAFLMERHWGDLRTLINLHLKNKTSQGPPFSDKEAMVIMLSIARGVYRLHAGHVLHRDLKAANVLIRTDEDTFKQGDALNVGVNCTAFVADFESSLLVQGTGFWRAPEVLKELKKPGQCDRNAMIWTEMVDVYSLP